MLADLKISIKRLIPKWIKLAFWHHSFKRRQKKFSKMSIANTFDTIYTEKLWARDSHMLSGKGSYGEWADKFVHWINLFIANNNINSIVDIGCGDFNIGSKICKQVTQYYALDVSQEIIKINQNRFKHLNNVHFIQIDACKDKLPKADLIILKEVLQHLTNTQIEAILCNIEASAIRTAVIADHINTIDANCQPNLDMRAHSPDTRQSINSYVLLSAPPFCRNVELLATISLPKERSYLGENGLLAIFRWDVNSNITEK